MNTSKIVMNTLNVFAIDICMTFKIVFLSKHYLLNTYTQTFFFIISLAFCFTSYAQEPIYQHFGVDEGLPSSQVYDIYQDKEGYIWFATDKGLSRYNGYEFENFTSNDGLPGNVVLRFYPQKNGEVWGYTFHAKSLFYFNENFDGFTTYKHNKLLYKELKLHSIVKSLFVNEFNTLQIGGSDVNGLLTITENGTVERKYAKNDFFVKGGPEKYIVLNNTSKEEVSYFKTAQKDVRSVFFQRSTNGSSHIDVTWLKHNEIAVLMDGNSLEIVRSNKKNKLIETEYVALGIKIIDSTQFFTGYLNGGSKILNNKGEVIQEYLKGKSVTSFLIDHEGGYWLTTLNSGVYYIKNPAIAVFKQTSNNGSLHINSLVKKKNELLIGYKNGGFAIIGANRTIKFEKARSSSYPSLVEYDSILDISYVFKNDKLEVNNKEIISTIPLKLSEPSLRGTIFSSDRGSFHEINKNKISKFPKRVQDISVWEKDTLIATPFGVFKKNKNSITNLSKESKLLAYRSDDIDVSTKGDHFFIATQGAGVVIYGKDVYNISTKEGLTSTIVNEIYIENDTTIWACTNKGLNRIVFYDGYFSVTSIDKNDGLLSNEVEDIEIINDTLWVGTKEGLSYMPKKVLDTNKHSDSIYLRLKEVTINDVVYAKNERPKIKYNENKITFFIQGISYAKNNDLEYQYRLKETDSKWSTTKNRNISFPNLSPGAYTFQARACIGNACYTEKLLEYSFIITPPFWKSGWFYALCFLVFVGLLYTFFKIRVLTYNKDVTREFIRLLIKRLKRDEKYLEIRMNGADIKIATNEILFIKSSGNYLDIISSDKVHTIRCKIGDFIASTPDVLEYLRVHRSYIIRIDKVTGKSKNSVTIKEHTIPVGETYLTQLDKIHF